MNPGTAEPTEFDTRAGNLFGFIPTLFEELVRSPAVANAYLSALEALEDGVLTKGERNIVMLAVSADNDSAYCINVHRALAREEDVETQDLNRIIMRQIPNNMRLKAITQTTWWLLDKRGLLDNSDLQYLSSLGIERRQVYEIIAIIGVKTIANYIQHIRVIDNRGGNGASR